MKNDPYIAFYENVKLLLPFRNQNVQRVAKPISKLNSVTLKPLPTVLRFEDNGSFKRSNTKVITGIHKI